MYGFNLLMVFKYISLLKMTLGPKKEVKVLALCIIDPSLAFITHGYLSTLGAALKHSQYYHPRTTGYIPGGPQFGSSDLKYLKATIASHLCALTLND